MPRTFTRKIRRGATRKLRVVRRAPVMRSVARVSAVKTMVKRMINRNEETKYCANAHDATGVPLAQPWYSNASLPAVGQFYPAIPQIAQGAGDHQRIGGKIQPVSLAVSLRIGFNPQDVSANSLLGVIYYGTDKSGKTWNGANPLSTAAILDDGDGTQSAFLGNRFDLTKPMDKKLVNARRIVFRLSKTEGIQNSDTNPGIANQGSYSTSNGPSVKSFLLKFRCPKTLGYLVNTSSYPQNFAPWYAVGFCHADGAPLQVTDRNLVNVTSQCHMYFKDA